MNFLPKVLLEKDDLKRTINSLMLEDNSIPAPTLTKNMPPINPPIQKKEEIKKEQPQTLRKEESKKDLPLTQRKSIINPNPDPNALQIPTGRR